MASQLSEDCENFDLLRCDNFSDTQHTVCMFSSLKKYHALYIKIFA
jgi:hypothetical protein